MIVNIAFYIVSSILLIASIVVILSKNPVHSVLSLVVVFFNAAIIFISLKAEYLAFVLIIVYVGAIVILFLFVVMMLDIQKEVSSKFKIKNIISATIILFLMMVEFYFILKINYSIYSPSPTYLISLDNEYNTIKGIGFLLYTNYSYVFIVCGIILTAGIIGVITLTYTKSTNINRQSVFLQNSRKNTVKTVKVKNHEGVN